MILSGGKNSRLFCKSVSFLHQMVFKMLFDIWSI
uniref:Uncharacterized protein n=1 Tax=Anguilla anguilla TaxID=7936 RepID=A0A0E9W6X0_ANGAN